ncbi:ParB N-terminal domain-containing protein [Mycobacterium sp. 134]
MTRSRLGASQIVGPRGERASERVLEALGGTNDDIVQVALDDLRCDFSPRSCGVDAKHVDLLAQSQAVMPPVIVHRSTLSVIDGAHRVHAARRQGVRTIAARFFDGSREEAFLLAVQANIAHGLPLRLSDRKKAAVRIGQMYPQWSDRRIAEAAGLSHKTVGALRARPTGEIPQSERTIGRDGRVRRAQKRPARQPVENSPVQPEGTPRSSEISVLGPASTTASRADSGGHVLAENAGSRPELPGDGWPSSDSNLTRIMQGLSTDPSLRFNNSGRLFLQWVTAGPRTPQAAVSLAAALPQHSVDSAFRIARRNAQMWSVFAVNLRDRMLSEDSEPDCALLADGELSGYGDR